MSWPGGGRSGWQAHLLFGLSRFEEALAALLTVTRLRPGDILGAAVLLAAIAWPTDASQARQYLQAALTSPGERLRPFTRAFYRAIALTGLDRADDALSELQAAASSRTSEEEALDDTDTALLNRFRDPPLPGLERLLQFFGAPQTASHAQEQADKPAGTPHPPSPARPADRRADQRCDADPRRARRFSPECPEKLSGSAESSGQPRAGIGNHGSTSPACWFPARSASSASIARMCAWIGTRAGESAVIRPRFACSWRLTFSSSAVVSCRTQ